MSGRAVRAPTVAVRLRWEGDAVHVLEKRPSAVPKAVDWDRLTRVDRCAVGACYALDEATNGAVSSGGDRAGVSIRTAWTVSDSFFKYLRRTAHNERYLGMVRDFSQMGGTSTYYYIAKCLGIRGYGTFLLEDVLQDESVEFVADIEQLDGIDTVVDLRMQLGWSGPNELMKAMAPVTELVEVALVRHHDRPAGAPDA